MKNYFLKIFSVYILILALIPCSDVCSSDVCLLDKEIHIEASVEVDHDDACTPLCVCLCCNSVITVSDKFVFEYFSVNTKLAHSEYLHFTYNLLETTSPPPKA